MANDDERNIEELSELADDASTSRKRDSYLPYLEAVLKVYREMRTRKASERESKRMCENRGIKNSGRLKYPIRRVIAATSKVDAKTASKMTLCLLYAYHQDWVIDVAAKIKKHGGIAGCAKKYSEL
jgi:hypothetical protein